MPSLRRTLAVLALGLAGACARPAAPVTVLAVAADLDEGTPLERDLVAEVQVPAALATANAVRPEGLDALVGRPIRVPLRQGDLLLASFFAGAEEPLSTLVQKKGRAVTLSVSGAEAVHAGDRVDALTVIEDPHNGEWMAQTAVQNAIVLSVGPRSAQSEAETRGFPLRRVSLLLLPEEAELLLLAGQVGALHLTTRNRDDSDIQQERGRATVNQLLIGERAQALEGLRLRTLQGALGPRAPAVAPAPVLAPAPAPVPVTTPARAAQLPAVPQLPSRDAP